MSAQLCDKALLIIAQTDDDMLEVQRKHHVSESLSALPSLTTATDNNKSVVRVRSSRDSRVMQLPQQRALLQQMSTVSSYTSPVRLNVRPLLYERAATPVLSPRNQKPPRKYIVPSARHKVQTSTLPMSCTTAVSGTDNNSLLLPDTYGVLASANVPKALSLSSSGAAGNNTNKWMSDGDYDELLVEVTLTWPEPPAMPNKTPSRSRTSSKKAHSKARSRRRSTKAVKKKPSTRRSTKSQTKLTKAASGC